MSRYLMRSNDQQLETSLAVMRLLWVIDRSPAEMKPHLTFNNGTVYGTFRWEYPDDGNGPSKVCRRWANPIYHEGCDFYAILAEFTVAVMTEIYGVEHTQWDETQRDEPVVIRLQWKGTPWNYYMGFDDENDLRRWLIEHEDWLTYERLR